MKKPLGKIGLTCCQAFLVIGLATWIADFRLGLDNDNNTSMVILADDWAIYGDLIWGESRAASTKIFEIFRESWEARPFRAIEYALQRSAYDLFGFHGGFYLQWLILTLSGVLFAMILRRRFSWPSALIGGLILVLHPADTTHIWLATMMAKLGILYTLLAIWFYLRGKFKCAGFLLLSSFLSYELAPFIFVMAPFFADGNQGKRIRQALFLFLGALAIYLVWRFFIFVEAVPDVRLIKGGKAELDWSLYALTYLTSIRDMLWRSTFATSLFPGWRVLTGIVAVATVTGYLFAKFAKTKATPCPWVLKGLLWGILTLLAGACLSFRAAPNATLGMASRHNIAAIVGAALVFVSLLEVVRNLLPKKWGQALAFSLGIFIVLIFAFERQTIQRSYQQAGSFQRRVLQEAISAIGPVPPHTLIVLGNPLASWPQQEYPMDPFVTGHAYEIEAICQLIYDKSVVGFCLEDANDLQRGKTSTAHAIAQENPAFHSVVYFDCKNKTTRWVKSPAMDLGEKRVQPHGPAWDYVLGT